MSIDKRQETKFYNSINDLMEFMESHKENWGEFDYTIVTSSANSDDIYVETDISSNGGVIDVIDGILTNCLVKDIEETKRIFEVIKDIFTLRLESYIFDKKNMN